MIDTNLYKAPKSAPQMKAEIYPPISLTILLFFFLNKISIKILTSSKIPNLKKKKKKK
jgi:hypothetical protein